MLLGGFAVGLVLAGGFFAYDAIGDEVAALVGFGGLADTASGLEYLYDFFADALPVAFAFLGYYCLFGGFAFEVGFPGVLTVDLLPGYFEDDL